MGPLYTPPVLGFDLGIKTVVILVDSRDLRRGWM